MSNGESREIVVYGAGGHGRVVADAAAASGFEVLGFIDDGMAEGTIRDGRMVLGKDVLAVSIAPAVALGIGDNRVRRSLALRLKAHALRLATVIHPRAVVSAHATVGEGAVVLANAVVGTGAVIGSGAIANTGSIVEHDAFVGDFSHVAPHATLCGAARVGAGALAGANSTILIGRSLGDHSILGAGAVLVRDIPEACVAAGMPAVVVRSLVV